MRSLLRTLLVDLGLAVVCAAVIMSVVAARSPKLAAKDAARTAAAGEIRAVVRGELSFAGEHAPPDEVRRSVASVGAFVQRRADITIDVAVVDRLAALERRTLDGELRRLTLDDVSAVFADVLCERIRDLDDAEIASAADAFGNVIPAGRLDSLGDDNGTRFAVAKRMRGMPASAAEKGVERPANDVMLRFDGSGKMSAAAFVDKMKEIRDRLRSPQIFLLVETQGEQFVREYLDERLAPVEEALPESWAGARTRGLTPVQALLTAYSAASDDALTISTDQLAAMQEFAIAGRLPAAKSASVAERRAPFGRYGDLFSTPLDAVFDAKTLGALLDKIEERASR
jgi:hypothetical protein